MSKNLLTYGAMREGRRAYQDTRSVSPVPKEGAMKLCSLCGLVHWSWTGKEASQPKRIICHQCGDPEGYELEWARTLDSPDPARFCDLDCANDYALRVTREQTRFRLWIHAIVEIGNTKKDLAEMGWADWGGGAPWPKRKKARK